MPKKIVIQQDVYTAAKRRLEFIQRHWPKIHASHSTHVIISDNPHQHYLSAMFGCDDCRESWNIVIRSRPKLVVMDIDHRFEKIIYNHVVGFAIAHLITSDNRHHRTVSFH